MRFVAYSIPAIVVNICDASWRLCLIANSIAAIVINSITRLGVVLAIVVVVRRVLIVIFRIIVVIGAIIVVVR